MASGGATAQLNVRIDRSLKDRGDAVLDQMGLSATEVIRLLWEKISLGTAHATRVYELMRDKDSAADLSPTKDCVLSEAQTEKLAALERGRQFVAEELAYLGVSNAALSSEVSPCALSDAESYAHALAERMQERGLA